VTPKGQGRNPIIFEALYLHNCARWTHGDDWRWTIYSEALVTNRMVSWLTIFIV